MILNDKIFQLIERRSVKRTNLKSSESEISQQTANIKTIDFNLMMAGEKHDVVFPPFSTLGSVDSMNKKRKKWKIYNHRDHKNFL